jgi:hypothetical protein
MARRAKAAPDSGTSVDDVADELYGLPLDDFTSARNERAKDAKQNGDEDAAKAIGKLAKPNTVAWLANQLVRQHRDEIDPLLELGGALRDATDNLDADQLRQLSKQQRQLVYALGQQARELANKADQPVSDSTARGLEDTLHAALADERVAEQLAGGRLTTTLTRSGFPGVQSEPGAEERGGKSEPPKGSGKDKAGRRDALLDAKDEERQARADADEADAARDKARDRVDDAEQAVQDAADAIERLKAELDDANTARSDADRGLRQARKEIQRAERQSAQAHKRAEDAAQRRSKLDK